MTFVVLKILDNLFSMQNSLNTNNCDVSKISKTSKGDLTFSISESSIHYVQFLIVFAKKNVASFT